MARLPGLRPFEDRPSVGGANRGRVQVRNPIGDKALTPQARPVDQYVRPQQPNAGPSGLAQLAGALAQISPSIQGFIEEDAARRKQEAEDLANKRIGGMSFAEAKAAVDNGSMTELQNPWFKAAFMKQYGERLAYQRMNELGQAYEMSPDKATMNMDEFVARQMQQDIEQYGNDRHFVSTYGQLMSGFNQKAGAAQAQFATQEAVGEAKQGVFETFLGRAEMMLQEGSMSPEEIAANLRNGYEGNKQLLGLSYKEQDAEMLRVAQALAERGEFEVVNALLTNNRTAADGTELGPLIKNRDFTADAANILSAAERKMWENNQTSSEATLMTFWDAAREGHLDRKALETFAAGTPGALSLSQQQQLISMNDNVVEAAQAAQARQAEELNREAAARASERDLLMMDLQQVENGMMPFVWPAEVLTKSGETREVSIETRKANVAAELVRQVDAVAASQGLDDNQKLDLLVERFSTSNLQNPVWKGVLEAGMTGATAWSVPGATLPPALKQGTQLYMDLYAKSPALLRKHITDSNVLDFYEAYRIGVQDAGLEPDQAIQTAFQITHDPDKSESNPLIRQTYAEIEGAAASVRTGWGPFGSSPANDTYVGGEIARTAKFYARTGMNAKKALELATERFKETHASINDVWFPIDRDQVGPNFETMAQNMITDYVAKFGEAEGVDASDLAVFPLGSASGAWTIINKNLMMPVEDRATRTFNLQTMMKAEEARREALRMQIVTDTNAQLDADGTPKRPPVMGHLGVFYRN